MLYVTNHFTISNVMTANLHHLRMQRINIEYVKEMLNSANPTFCVKNDPMLIKHITELTTTRTLTKNTYVMCKVDVAILVLRNLEGGEDNTLDYFRVTCRDEYEVMNFGEEHVILDRDGKVVSHVVNVHEHGYSELDELFTYAEVLNSGVKK